MPLINVHIFDTQADAQAAVDFINDALGFPASADNVTSSYTKAEQLPGLTQNWYIIADANTENILGPSIQIQVNNVQQQQQ